MLSPVNYNGIELVLHVLSCGCLVEESQIDFWWIVQICEYFGGSAVVFFELISFESEEENWG